MSAGTPAEFALADFGCADARAHKSHGQDRVSFLSVFI
jgi:hypothetical protein